MIALVLSLAAAMPVAPAASSPLEEQPCLNTTRQASSGTARALFANPSAIRGASTLAGATTPASAPKPKPRKLGKLKPIEDEYPCHELAPIRTTVEAIFPPVAQIEPEPQFTPVPEEAFETLAQPPGDGSSTPPALPPNSAGGAESIADCECFAGSGPIAFYPVPVGGGVFVPPQVTPITTPVPEPGVFALLLAGLAVMAWRRV